jgi:hypothetical protein
MVLAHIAGIPVEETALAFAPVGAALIAWVPFSVRRLSRSLHRRPRRWTRGRRT